MDENEYLEAEEGDFMAVTIPDVEVPVEEKPENPAPEETSKKAGMRWYTLHVYSSMEKSVQKAIIDRIERSELRDQFGEVLLPIEKVEENKNGKRRTIERRMYPGYVFVEVVMTEETWHLINSTPRVIEFLGNNHPVPLADHEIADIKAKMNLGDNDRPMPKVLFEAGETVRIVQGPFTEFNGRVEEVMYDKGRLRCFVSIFGRDTSVELAFHEVEKL